jgi:hypothetical protein
LREVSVLSALSALSAPEAQCAKWPSGYLGIWGHIPGSTFSGSAKIAGTPPVWMNTTAEPRGYFPARTSVTSAPSAFAV